MARIGKGKGIVSVSPPGIELVWLNTTNVSVEDAATGTIITNALLTGSGGVNSNFTVRNPWSQNVVREAVYTLNGANGAMMGLAKTSRTDNNYTDIDHAVWINPGEPAFFYIHELGPAVTSFAYVTGDKLKIKIVETSPGVFKVHYFLNDDFKWESATTPAGDYKMKISLFEITAEVTVFSVAI